MENNINVENFNNLMIDIETLSTRPDAAILSIGAVFFDPESEKLGAEFSAHIRMKDGAKYGHISPETVRWWMQQSEAARADAIKGDEHCLIESLIHLEKWIIANCNQHNVKVWAKSPSFDLVILTSAFARFDILPPWEYYNERDVRTALALKSNNEQSGSTNSFRENKLQHSALEDAKFQALQIISLLSPEQIKTGANNEK